MDEKAHKSITELRSSYEAVVETSDMDSPIDGWVKNMSARTITGYLGLIYRKRNV